MSCISRTAVLIRPPPPQVPRAFAVTGDAVWTVVENAAASGGAAKRFRAVDSAPISTLARVVSVADAPAAILEASPGSSAITGVPIWGLPTSEGMRTVELEFGLPGAPLPGAGGSGEAGGDGANEAAAAAALTTRRWVMRCSGGEASKVSMLLRSMINTQRAADAAEEAHQQQQH